MNKKFTILTAAFALLVALAIPLGMWGQTTIFSETFGDNGNKNTVYSDYSGYSATTEMFVGTGTVASHYSGTGKVGKNDVDASTGYDGASGYSAAWYSASSGNNTNNALVISGIDISGYTNLSLSFGMLKKNGTNTTNKTSVTYSIDGGSAQSLSFTHPTDAEWHLISGTLNGTGNSLTITFTMTTSGGYTSRYDDIVVTGTASTPTITISDEQLILPYEENDNGTFSVSYTNFTPVYATAALYYDEECSQAFPTSGTDAWILLGLDQYGNLVDPYDAIPFMVEENENPNSRPVYMKVEAMDDGYNAIEGVFTITQEGKPAPVPYINIVANHGETVENPYLIERPTWQNGGGFLREVEFGNFTVSGASDFQILYCNANGEPIDETPAMFSGVEVDYYYYQVFETYVYRLYVAVTNNHSTQDRSGYFKVWVNVNNTPVYSELVTVHQPGKPQVATPTFNPAAGKVEAGTTVAISCDTEGAAIQYSTDNGTTWTNYTAALPINEATTIQAKATKVNYVDSEVATAQYTIAGSAVFVDGVYSEPLDTQDSFENMTAVNVQGDEGWYFETEYECVTIDGAASGDVDWLITPKMQVDNGKLAISFLLWHSSSVSGLLAVKWSTSNDVNGEWNNIEFEDVAGDGSFHEVDVEITTEEPNVYLAFVYDNTTLGAAGSYSIAEFIARQCKTLTVSNLDHVNTYLFAGTESEMLLEGEGEALIGVGMEVMISVDPYEDYQLESLLVNGDEHIGDIEGGMYIFPMPNGDVAVSASATAIPYYYVSYSTNGIADGTAKVVQGEAIGTLPTATAEYIPAGYEFMGWLDYEYQVSDVAPNAYIGTDFEPEGDVTLYAVFAEIVTPAGQETWTKITDLSTVTEGVYALITENNYAFNGELSNKYIGQSTSQAFSFTSNVATSAPDGTLELTLTAVKNANNEIIGYTMYNSTKGYLYAAAAAKENLKWHNSEDSYWSYYTNSTNSGWKYNHNYGTSTTPAYGYLRTLSSDNTFRVYGNLSNQELYMAKKTPGTPAVYGNYRTSLLTNSDPLAVDGYTLNSDGGYKLIATPVYVSPSTVNGMTTGDFDLYYFDEAQDREEWRNYEASSFNLEPAKGYLYAKLATSNDPYEFTFSGTPYNDDGEVALSYTEGNQFAGWNLIGNPFTTAATLDMPFYKMNSDGDGFTAKIEDLTNTIAAMEGVFVQATAANQTATFTAPSRNGGRMNTAKMELMVIGNRGTVIDNAIVRFDEGQTLEKFMFNANGTKLYFTEGNQDYAIMRSNAEGEMPVNFKAETSGTYTISVNAENTEMNYLHLIDNMTGADIDLLAEPSYTFSAKTSDYASRFRLVFSGSSTSSETAETFAYYNGSEWVINNMGDATLQVVDVMGRVLSSETVSGNATLSTSNLSAGVYVMRLINGENVMTQKIVVR